jgi:predicted mannosyl-3-phosphoglycerate phosphatase (HAD superfamily)
LGAVVFSNSWLLNEEQFLQRNLELTQCRKFLLENLIALQVARSFSDFHKMPKFIAAFTVYI